jgi:hypothetical protein
MARIGAYDPDYTLAADDLAIAANTFDRSQNFHDASPE